MELALPHPHPCPWDPLLEIGRAAEAAINRHWGPGAAADVVSDMLAVARPGPLAVLLDAQQGVFGSEQGKRRAPSLLPLPNIRRALLGSVVNVVAAKLPQDEVALARMMKSDHDKLAVELIREGVNAAIATIGEHLQSAIKQTTALTKELLAG